jgi:hypothetical protein
MRPASLLPALKTTAFLDVETLYENGFFSPIKTSSVYRSTPSLVAPVVSLQASRGLSSDVGDVPPVGDPLDLPDPEPLKEHTADVRYHWDAAKGRLFIEGVSPEDVRQGRIANCYFAGAMGALAHTRPDLIESMVKYNPEDETYSFYFGPSKEEVRVDAQLYVSASGKPVYGRGVVVGDIEKEQELWFPLLEKAYAVWRGGYEKIGNGGNSGVVLAQLTGGIRASRPLNAYSSESSIYKLVQQAERNIWPMTASTYKEESLYTSIEGLHAWHCYTVLGAVAEDGKKYIRLRNPWGYSEPGHDGTDDGIFKLEVQDFIKYFQGIEYVKLS